MRVRNLASIRWAVLVCSAAATAAFAQTAPAQEPPPPPEQEPPLVTSPEPPEFAPSPAPPQKPPPPAAPAPASAMAEEGALVRVVLTDGQALRGRVVSEGSDGILLELVSGGRLLIPQSLIRAVEQERSATAERGQLWFKDANRTRYLFGPSAMMMKRGEAYFSQKELVLSEVGYGINDHFTVVAGAVPIAWFAGLPGLNAIAGLKAGTPIAEGVHVAGGAYALLLPNFASSDSPPVVAGFGFGTLTFGEENAHLSLSAGVPFVAVSPDGSRAGFPIFSLSGNVRLAQNVALVTENWLILDPNLFSSGGFLLAGGLAVRFMGERFSVDVGGVWPVTQQGLPTNGIPIPWLDFTYHFDIGRK